MKWSTWSGKNVCQVVLIRTFAQRTIYCTWMEKMFFTEKCLKLSMIFRTRIKKIMFSWETISPSLRTFFSTYTRVYSEIYCSTEGEALTCEAPFSLFLRFRKTKKGSASGEKSTKLHAEKEQNQHQKSVEIDAFNEKEGKDVKGRIEKSKLKKVEKWPKKISCWRKKGKSNRTKKLKKRCGIS